MKVIELMNKNVISCHPTEPLTVIINKFELFNITGMPVVEKGQLVGIICQSDILKKIKEEEVSLKELMVKDVMSRNVITTLPTESVVEVAKIMIEKQINRVPVVENNKVVGIVTRTDIVRAVAECG
ncbi:MAG: CBS domain-containing protein [Syntrophorhabdaceae bacterium]|nr:CBS domain-containing protein [Syntrophorhabdaceae bacterium]